jgi:ABC-type polysaccharide/polyol phosphate transport system ATPase subunit
MRAYREVIWQASAPCIAVVLSKVFCVMQVRITFKNQELLKGVCWEVKKGERVGLVGELHAI